MKSLVFALLVILLAVPAFAGWTVTNLNPAGATRSNANGVCDGQVVGDATISGVARASLWTNGSPSSWIGLNAGSSNALANTTSLQAGQVAMHASIWSGSASSRVDIHPTQASSSAINDVYNNQQAGWADINSWSHASTWNGTRASWVDLNPIGVLCSGVLGLYGNQQAGWAELSDNRMHAILWNGTAASWVDLSPPGSNMSYALDVFNGVQAGHAQFSGYWHAGLWNGTAGSWIDLHPAGMYGSYIYGSSDGKQVGNTVIDSLNRACIWSSSASSWIDLHALLPVGAFTESIAFGVDVSGDEIWVAGDAYTATGNSQAMLWHFTPDPVPEPSSVLTLIGGIATFGLACRRRKH